MQSYSEIEDRRIPSGNGMREVIVVPGSENLGIGVVYMEREDKAKEKGRRGCIPSLLLQHPRLRNVKHIFPLDA